MHEYNPFLRLADTCQQIASRVDMQLAGYNIACQQLEDCLNLSAAPICTLEDVAGRINARSQTGCLLDSENVYEVPMQSYHNPSFGRVLCHELHRDNKLFWEPKETGSWVSLASTGHEITVGNVRFWGKAEHERAAFVWSLPGPL